MPFCVFVSLPFGACLFVVISTFGGRHKNTKYARQNRHFNRRRHENFFVENFVSAGRNLSCCCTLFDVFSPRNAKVEVTTKRHVFVSSPRKYEMA